MRCGARCRPGGGRAWGLVVARAACTGKRTGSRLGGQRARAKRTSNMLCMVVTLEVSKLSGWFSFCAPCQPKGGACDMGRGADGEAVGSGAAQAGMQTGKVRPQGLGVRARVGRTENMLFMSVTLEVSQLSGWLNAFAICRVEGRARNAGRGVRWEAGGRGAAAAVAACTEMARLKTWGPGHARSARRTCGSWS
jgi:hypothetical protein